MYTTQQQLNLSFKRSDGVEVDVPISRLDAWYAARQIAKRRQMIVKLRGEFGDAYVRPNGTGVVIWNERSLTAGCSESFGAIETVCL